LEKLKFFHYGEKVAIPPNFDTHYLNYLENREKLEIVGNGMVALKDFSGYIGETLYIPRKLKTLLNLESEEEYKKIFNNLFSVISSKLSEDILFQLFPSSVGLSTSSSKPSPIFQLNTLLQYSKTLIFALDRVLKSPHRRLVDEVEYRPFEEISYIDETIFLDHLQNPQNWFRNSPRRPIKVLQYRNLESIDTIENRFIKKFLFELYRLLPKLLRYVEEIPEKKAVINEIISKLENFQQDFPIDKIGNLQFIPYNSQVLLKRAGYRELFTLYTKLKNSFTPSLFEHLDSAISLKDISTIWEYYVISILITKFGKVDRSNFERNLKIGNEIYDRFYIRFQNGIVLKYQHTIYSYSNIPFRPDFYIEYQDKKIVLDAKFRILEENRSDIYKNLHYYRDGLSVDLVLAIVIGNREGGEVYTPDQNRFILQNIDDLFSFRGIGHFAINLKELLK